MGTGEGHHLSNKLLLEALCDSLQSFSKLLLFLIFSYWLMYKQPGFFICFQKSLYELVTRFIERIVYYQVNYKGYA